MKDNDTLIADIKLRFNISHPSIEECYLFGYECAQSEIGESENPFTPGTKENHEWIEGWWDGFYGDKPIFNYESDQKELEADVKAANDQVYHDKIVEIVSRVVELTSVLAVSALVAYQLIDLVA